MARCHMLRECSEPSESNDEGQGLAWIMLQDESYVIRQGWRERAQKDDVS